MEASGILEGTAAIRRIFAVADKETQDFRKLLPAALAAMRRHLGMEVAFLSEFVGGRRVFRFVDAEKKSNGMHAGASDPLEDSYCQHVVDGRLPELMVDARTIAAAKALAAATESLPVGAHLSVPVRLPDGSVYGTFCCFSTRPNPSLNERDLAIMRVFADWIADALGNDKQREHDRQEVRQRIESVLAGDALSCVYQPICRLATKSIVGFECLSRFSTVPRRGPDFWFADAQSVGLGAELELRAIENGLRGLAHLPEHTYVSVNISPRILTDQRLLSVLAEWPAQRVVIELTEHETIAEYAKVLAALRDLRSRGVRTAVDDAGGGFSSFHHILEIMPSFIKLDVTLTRGIERDPARRALTAAMVRFCAETQAELIAEGIETESELRTLQDLGVLCGQGYFLHKPQPLQGAVSLAVARPVTQRAQTSARGKRR
jgi:EAL domain-containing protein (putative c-di-GMP-specific phosphodiesterase class I)